MTAGRALDRGRGALVSLLRRAAGNRRDWLSPRGGRFRLVAGCLLYTAVGFLLLPLWVESLLTGALSEGLARETTVERVRVNPWVLSLEVRGFALNDSDGRQIAGFDRLFVNFQLSSLFRRAWTFREVRLEGAALLLERFADGKGRLSRLLADRAERAAAVDVKPEPIRDGGMPRLLVHRLVLDETRVRFRDAVPAEPVDLLFGPLSLDAEGLSTLPDREGRQAVTAQLPYGGRARWQGSIALAPFGSAGSLELHNVALDPMLAYLRDSLPLDELAARLALNTEYRLGVSADGGLELELDGLDVSLADVLASGLDPPAGFFRLPELKLSGGSLRLRQRSLEFGRLELSEPVLQTWLTPDGGFNLLGLVPAEGTPAEPAVAAQTGPEWRLGIAEVSLAGGRIGFRDDRIEPPAELEVQDLDLAAEGLNNLDGAEFSARVAGTLATGGEFSFEGRAAIAPEFLLTGTVRAADVQLRPLQPWVGREVDIRVGQGVLASNLELNLTPEDGLRVAGDLAVDRLEVIDGRDDEPLAGWNRLAIEQLEADVAKRAIGLSRVRLEGGYGRITVNQDHTTNLSGLAAGSVEEGATADAPWSVRVGGVAVRDAKLDFADRSLPLPFATRVEGLGGTISTIDTASAAPAEIDFEGRVEDFGLARVSGTLNALEPIQHADLAVEFRNLRVSDLSPYTVEFAGRKIAEGRLDLDLGYRIEEGLLKGENDVVLSDLVLGEKVEHPGATSLPLGLAVALLKDANGVIDIDLPVEGDVNDPKFSIGGVIWQAFASLITKVVTAPFQLLGRLVGAGSGDLGEFQFLPGRADLTPPELEKVGSLREALEQRPELNIEIAGGFSTDLDVPALQLQQLREALLARLGTEFEGPLNRRTMLSDEVRDELEDLHEERFPDTSLGSLKDAHRAPPADDLEGGRPVLDERAYAADLRDRLIESEAISRAQLDILANARAEAISNALLAGDALDAGRVSVAPPEPAKATDDRRVVIELRVKDL